MRLLEFAALAALMAGCSANSAFIGTDGGFGGDDFGLFDSPQRMLSSSARLSGDMPEVGAFDTDAFVADGIRTSDFMSLDVQATGPFGWAMVAVFADRDPSTGELVLDGDDSIGCTGPDLGFAVFDETPSDIDVVVSEVEVEGMPQLDITIDATFGTGETLHADVLIPADEIDVGF